MTVQDIYGAIDAFAPFSAQEKWDNSGLLVGDPAAQVTGVLVCLDIDAGAIREAEKRGCNLIVSHHPVIFTSLSTLSSSHPVYALAGRGMSAICCHTPLDMASDGINGALAARLSQKLSVEKTACLESSGMGRLLTLGETVTARELADAVKACVSCAHIRLYDAKKPIRTLGLCGGSAASMLEDVAGSCDAFLTGDVKHDRWYKAQELGITLLDAGHFETEIAAVEILRDTLRAAFPELPVFCRAQETPFCYA